jgi:hypothetical protein
MDNNTFGPDDLACLGVMCPAHGKCQRYAAVEQTPQPVARIGTCVQGNSRPLFMLRAGVTMEQIVIAGITRSIDDLAKAAREMHMGIAT